MERLREQMIDGTLPPGATLNISEIAEGLGVSVVPVREAVKILQSEGRLVRDRSRSYRVRELDYEELIQMNQLSTYLEIELIKSGVPRLSDDDIAEMKELNAIVARREGERADLVAAHRRLHFVCFEAANKTIFLENVNRLWDHYEHYRLLFFDGDTKQDDATIEHQEFFEACANHDVDLAVSIHERHRRNSFEYLSKLAERAEQPDA